MLVMKYKSLTLYNYIQTDIFFRSIVHGIVFQGNYLFAWQDITSFVKQSYICFIECGEGYLLNQCY